MILDGDEAVRARARAILSREPSISTIEAANVIEAMAWLVKEKPDIILTNFSVGGSGYLNLFQAIKARHSGIHLLAASFTEECQYFFEIPGTRADSYLIKASSPDHFLATLLALKDNTEMTTRISDTGLLRNWAANAQDRLATGSRFHLTPREEQMLKMLALGKSNKEIAEMFSIKTSTVRTHRSALMSKLGIPDQADIIRFSVSNGFITPS